MEEGAPGYLSYGWVIWLSNVDLNPAIDVLLKVFFFFLLTRWEGGKRSHGKENIISLCHY